MRGMKGQPLLLMIPQMRGGGAERVLGLLASQFAAHGHDVTVMLTNQRVGDAIGYTLHEKVKMESLLDYVVSDTIFEKGKLFFIKQYTRIIGNLFEALHCQVPDHVAYGTFHWQYQSKVVALRKYLQSHSSTTTIVFSQPSVNIALLAADGLPNEVILSERLDPARYVRNRYMPYFVKRWYPTAKRLVFQTDSAMSFFKGEVLQKSVVIPNPLNPDLPPAYHGERRKAIVSFCRITPQKNLKLLIDAYAIVCEQHPDYRLEIYGDGEGKAELLDYIQMKQLDSRVDIKTFDATLHSKILDNAMFVSSSDYEGMSNSMLEAMAIGLPTICTDCPAGGARAIIHDHENGLLVPVRDVEALVQAMNEVIENPSFAQKLSENGALLREELNVETIAKRWMELL